jgi:hypothetical protein
LLTRVNFSVFMLPVRLRSRVCSPWYAAYATGKLRGFIVMSFGNPENDYKSSIFVNVPVVSGRELFFAIREPMKKPVRLNNSPDCSLFQCRINWKMKTKLQLALSLAFGSLVFVGCISDNRTQGDAVTLYDAERPVDLTDQRPDTYRADRTGLDDYAHRDVIIQLPSPTILVEASGAELR